MPASPLDLRPRRAVELLDAAITACARSSGLWSLALPGGALVAAALIHFTEAVERRADVASAAFLLTAAWMLRAVFQGGASLWLEGHLLDAQSPAPFAALRSALGRTPSLFIAAATLPLIDLIGLSLTAGIALLFLSAHVVGYAVAVRGRGAPWRLFGSCRRMLGAANRSTLGVRLSLLWQVLVFFNLHIAANVGVFIGRKLLGIDLTYLDRYASLDNRAWVIALFGVTFALTEPLRAAVATLLLIDGRIREEGLDLLAAVDRLPRRRRRTLSASMGAASVVGLAFFALLIVPTSAAATGADSPSALSTRLEKVATACGEEKDDLEPQLAAVEQTSRTQQAALSRFVQELERRQEEPDNCEAVLARLETGLPLIVQARDALRAEPVNARTASQRAALILSRSEFVNVQPSTTVAEAPESPDPSKPESAWRRALHWIGDALDRLFKWLHERLSLPTPAAAPSEWVGGQMLANVLVVMLVAAVVMVLAWILWRSPFRRRSIPGIAGARPSTDASDNNPSALSRPSEGWAHLADELAGRGEFREAIRGLYLALLSRMHRDGAIDYDPALSNWDYLVRFKGPRSVLSTFRELTSRFDFAFYGRATLVEDSYREFRSLAAPLLAITADARNA